MAENRPSGFLSRHKELERAGGFLQSVQGGRPSALVITGEPGIGKTSLARHVVDEARSRGFDTAWAWCWATAEAPSLWPWRQVVAELGWRDLSFDDVGAAFEGFAARARAQEAPVLVTLDDAHGADEASLAVANLCVRSLGAASIGLLVTVCEEDVLPRSSTARLLDAISQGGTRIDLFGLGQDAVAKLFAQTASAEVPPLIKDAILSASGGNPFFVQQLAREVSVGHDVRRPDRSLGFRVPRGADAVLDRILERLSSDTRTVLTQASVLGRTFSKGLLASLASVEEAAVDAALDEAVEKAALRTVDSLGTYEFTHALLREHLYEDLSAGERARLHLEAARAIESQTVRAHLSELAHHLFKAGTDQDVAHAVEVIMDAGRQAQDSGAPEEAARQFYRASRLAEAGGIPAPDVDKVAPTPTPSDDTAVRQPATGLMGTFRRQGEFWEVGLGEETTMLKDSKGLGYVAALLAKRQDEVHCLDLGGGEAGVRLPSSGDVGALLDPKAKQEYRRRLLELDEEIAEATEFHDEGRLRKAEDEKGFLLAELKAATGLGGRDRVAGAVSERARVAVTRAIRSALRRISAAHPSLGDHLDRTIHTGTFLSYRPDPLATPDWQL